MMEDTFAAIVQPGGLIDHITLLFRGRSNLPVRENIANSSKYRRMGKFINLCFLM